MRSMTVYNFLFEASLLGSVLILLLCAARACLRRRVGSRLLYGAWLPVALRLLIPLALPNPLMNELRPELSTDMAARPVADQIRVRIIDAAWDMAAAIRAATGGDGVSEWIDELGSRTFDGQTGKWILLAYVLVGVALACLTMARRHRFRRFVRRNRVAELHSDDLLNYHRLCVRFDMAPAPVYYVDRLKAPCVVGTFQPMIALPVDTAQPHLQAILTRELSHILGRDGLWGAVRELCCAVHWLNPLIWYAARLNADDGELACDERACLIMDSGERLRYADALASADDRPQAGLGLMKVYPKARERQLKARMTTVLSSVRVKGWVVATAAAVCVCALVCSFATEEKYAPVSISVIPKVMWRAGAENIDSQLDAVGYARRFLESPYVEIVTEHMRFEAERESDGDGGPSLWRVAGLSLDGQSDVLLRFFGDGTLMEYNGLAQIVDVDLSTREKTAPVPSESVREYLRSFAKACLPHQKWVSVRSRDDAAGVEKRFLLFDVKLVNESPSLRHAPYTAKLGALLDDRVRVVYYSMGGEEV